MRLPHQAPAIARRASISPLSGGIDPSGCSLGKKIACASAVLACGAVCVGSLGTACLSCVSTIVGGCNDCL